MEKDLTFLFCKWTASWGHHSDRKQEFSKWVKGRLKISNRKRPGICFLLPEVASVKLLGKDDPAFVVRRSLGGLSWGLSCAVCLFKGRTRPNQLILVWTMTFILPCDIEQIIQPFWVIILSCTYNSNVLAPLDNVKT